MKLDRQTPITFVLADQEYCLEQIESEAWPKELLSHPRQF